MATLREIYEAILMEESISPTKVGTLAARLANVGRGKGQEIIHQIGPDGFHRLIVDGKKSLFVSPTEIIRIGDFIATTDAFINMLPQVGKVFSLKSKDSEGKGDFTTEAVQSRKDD